MPGGDGRTPAQLLFRAAELHIGQPHQQRVDADVGDGTADVLAGALVRAAAEGEVGAVALHARGQVRADARVEVARRGCEQQAVALADALPAQLGVLLGVVAEDGAERRLVPQRLLDGLRHGHLAAAELGAEARLGEDHAQRVGEEVRGGLVGREEDEPQVFADLVVAESGRVGDQVRGEVVLGPGTAPGGEPAQRVHDVGVALDGGLGALQGVPRGLHHAVVVLLGHAEDLAHDGHRQMLGELGDQVGPAAFTEAVDQALGVAADVAAHAAVVDGGHGRGDRRAQPLVLVALGVRADRLPGDVRHERVVGLDHALGQRAPDPAVAGVEGGAAHQVQVLGVSEDHPHGHVVVEQDGGHGAVLLPQPLVEVAQVLRVGAVEPVQPAGAEAVRGAARRRDAGGVCVGQGREFRRHGVAPERKKGVGVGRLRVR